MAYTIKQILSENWHNYLKTHKVEDYKINEVEKTINCSKHSCNGRICSSCGKRYTDGWSDRLQNYLFPVEHRHVVLTVPSILMPILRDWNKIKLLMDSSKSFFIDIFN
jgi:hypothetical protein